jgi:hypothetical protein
MRRVTRKTLLKAVVPLVAAGAVVTLVGSPAQAASGSNGTVYITVVGTPSGWNASGRWDGASANDDWTGHIQIIGPNGFSRNGANAYDPSLNNVTGTGAGQVCAIGWAKNANGTYTKQGEPCETIS